MTMPPAADLRGVLHLSAHTANVGEIGYGIAPSYRCQGQATRAVTLVAAWAFARLGLARLETVVTAPGMHGQASQRVAEKAGFVPAGMRLSHLPAIDRVHEDPICVLLAPVCEASACTDRSTRPKELYGDGVPYHQGV
jgi:hypothetical protein